MSSWAMMVALGLLAGAQIDDKSAVATVPPTDPIVAATPGPAAGSIRLPAAMPVDIEIAEPLGSNTSRIDDMFAIRIGSPILQDGKIVVAAGVLGRGQVVHAAKSGGLGKAGELILAARFIECGGVRIALRGMRLTDAGKDNSGKVIGMYAAGAALLGAFSAAPLMFISGGKVVIPAGTHAIAKLAESIDVPVAGCAAVAVAPAPIAPGVPAGTAVVKDTDNDDNTGSTGRETE